MLSSQSTRPEALEKALKLSHRDRLKVNPAKKQQVICKPKVSNAQFLTLGMKIKTRLLLQGFELPIQVFHG